MMNNEKNTILNLNRIKGENFEKLFIDNLAARISEVVNMSKYLLKLFIIQSIKDAFVKDGITPEDVTYHYVLKKYDFFYSVIINMIKRAKLVGDVDVILPLCNEIHNKWLNETFKSG